MLAHILDKPYKQILAEFKDPLLPRKFRDDLGFTGDVKYHMGSTRDVIDGVPMEVMVRLAPNPSHLEAVNPVVEGMARAAGTDVSKPGAPVFNPRLTQPILIHGDAAFPGQGIVAETLNLSQLPGYWTGGTIHIITNNQLGFTTEPSDARSTLYASDLAKGFKMPIVHVNADDPEACIAAARLACAYRRRFGKDFVIDLIGYRRYGHNEGDEPNFTQPLMYQIIDQHPTARALWADELVRRGTITPAEADVAGRRQDAGAASRVRVARPGKRPRRLSPLSANSGDGAPRPDQRAGRAPARAQSVAADLSRRFHHPPQAAARHQAPPRSAGRCRRARDRVGDG